MLRNGSRPVAILTLLLAFAGAGCGGGDGEEPAVEGVRFAVYDSEEQLGEPADAGTLRCGPPRSLCPPELIEPTGTYRYSPRGEPALDSSVVASARVETTGDQPLVVVELTLEGTQAFRDLTRGLSERGRELGRNQHAAIVVGDEVVALAAVDPQQYPQGIETTNLQFYAAGDADADAVTARINGDA